MRESDLHRRFVGYGPTEIASSLPRFKLSQEIVGFHDFFAFGLNEKRERSS